MAEAPPLKCPECGAEFQFAGANPHYNRARHVESAHLGGGHWSFDRQTAPWYYKEEHGWKAGTSNVGTSPREDVNESARFNQKHRAFFEAEAREAFVRARGGGKTGKTHTLFNRHPTDRRTVDEKLEAMIDPKSGATEGERRNAEHLLFKRRQARGEA